MNYTLYQNNNRKSPGYEKFYARASYNGTVTTADIAEVVQRNCSMKKSDVLAVISELVEVMQDKMQEGYKIKLDGFGIFKIGLKSTGVDAIDQFMVSHNIVGARVNFQPTRSLNSATGETKTTFLSGMKLRQK